MRIAQIETPTLFAHGPQWPCVGYPYMELLPIIRLFIPSGGGGAQAPVGDSQSNQAIVREAAAPRAMQIVMLIGTASISQTAAP